jgi:glyoxylase-like metal-dependent hydrolase (beta-lactamase superfamily II)
MKIINLTYKLTNCYLIHSNCGFVMIDAGWANTLPELFRLLKENDVKVDDIKYLIVTHFHPDHAGLVQDLKEFGTKLILHENQVSFVEKLNKFFKKSPKSNFKNIVSGDNIVVSSDKSRAFLKKIGIDGEIIETPGHTDDSISLIIDKCCAFTGDLPNISLVEAYDDEVLKESWRLIQEYNVKNIYPAHGNSYAS